jgi:hypothetical protein
MVAIKVQCGCGQRYSFDVEPVGGRMPNAVSCPACGADGTAAANEMIAQKIQAAAPGASAVRVTLRPVPAPSAPAVAAASAPVPAAKTASPARPAKLQPGQLERPNAEAEARAQIFWGEPPEEVVKFLMRNNISVAESRELVEGFFAERAAALRSSGMSKIFTGIGMIALPIAAWFTFMAVGVIYLKIFALTVIVGLWGAGRVIRGAMMVTSPKSETGDVSEQ